MSAPGDDRRLVLEASTEKSGGSLRIPFTIRNLSRENAFVAVRAVYPEGEHPDAPSFLWGVTPTLRGLGTRRPYTVLAREDSALWLCVETYPLPPGVERYAPILPLHRELSGGGVLKDAFEVEIPASELHPYSAPAPEDATFPVGVEAAILTLECIFARDARWIDDRPGDGLVYVSGARQRLLADLVLDAELSVLKRTDGFFRAPLMT